MDVPIGITIVLLFLTGLFSYAAGFVRSGVSRKRAEDDCSVCGPNPFSGIRDEGCLLPGSGCPRLGR
jgi:hypothetical protein